MRPDERDLRALERREAHGGAFVVAEDEERPPERQRPARHRHPVHDRAHAVLAYAEVDLAAREVVPGDRRVRLQLRPRVFGEVRTAPDEAGNNVENGVERGRGRLAGGEALAGVPRRELRLPPVAAAGVDDEVVLLAQFDVSLSERAHSVAPRVARKPCQRTCRPRSCGSVLRKTQTRSPSGHSTHTLAPTGGTTARPAPSAAYGSAGRHQPVDSASTAGTDTSMRHSPSGSSLSTTTPANLPR